MKKLLLLFVSIIFIAYHSAAQYIVAEDNAGNYSTWNNGNNNGFGFGAWDLWVENSGGHFIGNSASQGFGNINTNDKAFGMWGNPSGTNVAHAQRLFQNWNDGASFSVEIATAYRNGYKGIDLWATEYDKIWTFNVGGDNYTAGGTNLGWAYSQTSVFVLTATQNGSNVDITLTRGSDSYSTTINNKTLIGFKFYIGSTNAGNDLNNLFFNKLKVEYSNPTKIPSSANVVINGSVELAHDKNLTVSNFTVSAPNSFTIKSNASGTGSLIVNGTFTGIATVERYLSKYDAQGDNKYHFISSPVAAQNIQPEFVSDPPSPSVDFYKFSETNYEWVNSKLLSGDWNPAFESQFEVGRGYMVAYSVNLTKNFNGALNNNASYVLNCTHTADKGNGWNLLGNPYQAAIDWDAVTLGDGMDNALYYYDSQNEKYNYYIAFAGINNTQYLGTGSRYIPSMQGFMVHAKSTGTKTVTIEKADLAHQAQTTFYKSGYNLVPGSMALTLISGERRDEAFVHFTSGATEAFDGQYDAYKLLSGNAAIPEIYTTNNGNVKFAINGLPELGEQTEVPVSIKANQPGVYTISADLSNLPATAYLNDLKTGTVHNLSQNPIFTFTAAEGDAPNRFKLTFGSVGIEQPVAQCTKVYTSENMLYLLTGGNAARVEVFSLTGQKQMDVETRSNVLPLNLATGIYLVKVTTSAQTHVQKIIVK